VILVRNTASCRQVCAIGAALAFAGWARAQSDSTPEPFFGTNGVICVVEHSHSDIAWNWTTEQEMEVRNRNLESVMRLLRKDSGFKWTIECVLFFQNWLAGHPEAEKETIEFIRKGQLDCGATYTQPFEDCLYGELLARQMYVGKRWFENRYPGLALTLVANQDAPMRGLQAQQVYAKAGVQYLKGSRMNTPGFFRWLSPDGSHLVAWFQDAYWGRPRIDADSFRQGMRSMEGALRRHRLPPVLAITWGHDYNDPMDVRGVLDDWNRNAAAENRPTAVYATFGEVLREVEKRGVVDSEIRGDVPNWWVYENWPSHCRAMTAQRDAAKALVAAETFHAVKSLIQNDFSGYPKDAFDRAWRDASYACHTMVPGHNPAPDRIMLDKYLNALSIGRSELTNAVSWIAQRVCPDRAGVPVVVFNPLSWERTDPVTVGGGSTSSPQVIDSAGQKVPCQVQGDGSVVFVAEKVPPVGYRTYYLVPDPGSESTDVPAPGTEWNRPFESRHYVVTPAEGGIRSIVDRDLGKELVSTDRWLAFEWITFGTRAMGACEGIDFNPHPEQFFDRLSKHKPKWKCIESGPVYVCWSTADSESTHCKVRLSLKIYRDIKRIDVGVDVIDNDTQTGVEQRLIFPVRCAAEEIAYEVPFGVVEPGKSEPFVFVNKGAFAPPGKVPTTPREVQDWVYATGDGVGVTIGSSVGAFAFRDFDPDAVRPLEGAAVASLKFPDLLSVGMLEPAGLDFDLTDKSVAEGQAKGATAKVTATAKGGTGAVGAAKGGREVLAADVKTEVKTEVLSPILLACIRNPKGACTQPGNFHFEFSLVSHHPGYRNGYRQGVQSRNPLIAMAVAPRKGGELPATRRFFSTSGTNVTISAIKKAEDDDSIVVRLYDVEGVSGSVRIQSPGPIAGAERTDLLERNGKGLTVQGDEVEIQVGAYAIETVKIRSKR
jgi:alpha-mannosidase